MADIDLRRAHDLGLEAARAAAERLAVDLGRRFDLRGDWQGNVLRFERPGVNGALTIGDKDVHLTVTLGFLLKAMKGSIERAVSGHLDALFAEGRGEATPPRRPPPAAKGRKAAPPRKRGA